MYKRQALEDARSASDIDALEDEVNGARRRLLSDCAEQIDQKQDFPAAAQQVRALMFLERFGQDVEKRREALSF